MSQNNDNAPDVQELVNFIGDFSKTFGNIRVLSHDKAFEEYQNSFFYLHNDDFIEKISQITPENIDEVSLQYRNAIANNKLVEVTPDEMRDVLACGYLAWKNNV